MVSRSLLLRVESMLLTSARLERLGKRQSLSLHVIKNTHSQEEVPTYSATFRPLRSSQTCSSLRRMYENADCGPVAPSSFVLSCATYEYEDVGES